MPFITSASFFENVSPIIGSDGDQHSCNRGCSNINYKKEDAYFYYRSKAINETKIMINDIFLARYKFNEINTTNYNPCPPYYQNIPFLDGENIDPTRNPFNLNPNQTGFDLIFGCFHYICKDEGKCLNGGWLDISDNCSSCFCKPGFTGEYCQYLGINGKFYFFLF